jgi:hypothetical protein
LNQRVPRLACPFTTQTVIIALKDPFFPRWLKFISLKVSFAINDCKICENRILYKNRLFISENSELKMQITYITHDSKAGGPSKIMKTTKLISKLYFWFKITYNIENYVCWNHTTAIVQRQAQGYAVALRPGDVT